MHRTFVRILNRLGLVKKFNLTSTVRLNNKSLAIPLLKGTGLPNFYISEPWMIDLLKIVIPIDNKRFIDVGVNVGQTLLKLRSVSWDIDYVGFEPNSNCVQYVTTLVKLNKFENFRLIPVGIADETSLGELKFFTDRETDDAASILEEFRPEQPVISRAYIPIFTSKDIQETINLDEISILKIDVEGAELEVVKSFYEDIKTKNPIIFIEILPAYSEDNTYRLDRQNEIVKLLKDANYCIFHVQKPTDELIGFNELTDIGVHSDITACDYVMVPQSKREAFLENVAKFLNK